MSEKNEYFNDNIDNLINEVLDNIMEKLPDEPMDQWWNTKLELIGKNGVIMMYPLLGGVSIQYIHEKDWETLISTASELVRITGNILGLEISTSQNMADTFREDLLHRIIESMSDNFQEADTFDLDEAGSDIPPF